MAQNGLLAGGHNARTERYAFPMEERAQQPAVEQHAPNGQPPTPAAPYGQPWPPYGPPPKRGPAWLMPLAIVVAALLLAGAVVAFAILSNKSGGSPAAAGNQPSASAAAQNPSGADTATLSTCQGWQTTSSALDQIQDLPDGWDWDTPGIDGLIARRDAALRKALDLFDPQIAAQPANIADAAHAYISSRREEMKKLEAHTYTQADGVAGNAALARLNQLCHVAG